MTWWYVSTPRLTGAVEVNENNVIVSAPPILRKFTGRPARSLGDYLRKSGGYAHKTCEPKFEKLPESTHVYVWGNTERREKLKGRRCRIIARGSMRTVLVEFENGEQVTTSIRALRKENKMATTSLMKCDTCNRPLNERIETIWNLVEGWEKKREGGGTNHLALRKPKEHFRCNGCMQLILDGLSPQQSTLGI